MVERLDCAPSPLEASTANDGDLPSVSIVVPVYNSAATVRDCIASLLALRFPRERMEIVMVDNGSTDGTLDILHSFGDAITLLHEPKRGAGAARNRGVGVARGEIVAFTDADCVVDADWLRALVPSLGDPSVGIVGGVVLSPTPCNRIERFGERIHDQKAAIEEPTAPYVITGNWASRRAVLLEVGLFDASLPRGQDVDLSWRIRRAGYGFVYEPRARVFHRNESTLRGLIREGFVHGFHNAQVRLKHVALGTPISGRRMHIRQRLAKDVRKLIRDEDRVSAALGLLFDFGKSAGELWSRARPRPVAGSAGRAAGAAEPNGSPR